jgi:hypothetical protein
MKEPVHRGILRKPAQQRGMKGLFDGIAQKRDGLPGSHSGDWTQGLGLEMDDLAGHVWKLP